MTEPLRSSELDAANQSAYATDASVSHYAAKQGLKPAEQAILAGLGTEVTEGLVLDLGIGAGRTTGPLQAMAGTYVGIDYVPELVAAARAHHPDADIEVGDARDLARFADGEVDVAFFSFNGIDGVTHDDRLAILAEVRRVLKPGGAFVFSAHNREWERFGRLPWQGRGLRGLASRVVLRKSWEAWRARANRARLKPQEVHTDTYAIVNDEAHEWSLLLYYVESGDQVAQLEAAGFSGVQVFDMHGRPGDPLVHDPASIWLHYLARA